MRHTRQTSEDASRFTFSVKRASEIVAFTPSDAHTARHAKTAYSTSVILEILYTTCTVSYLLLYLLRLSFGDTGGGNESVAPHPALVAGAYFLCGASLLICFVRMCGSNPSFTTLHRHIDTSVLREIAKDPQSIIVIICG